MQRVANNVLCNPEEETVENHQNSLEETKFKAPVPKKVVYTTSCVKRILTARVGKLRHERREFRKIHTSAVKITLRNELRITFSIMIKIKRFQPKLTENLLKTTKIREKLAACGNSSSRN